MPLYMSTQHRLLACIVSAAYRWTDDVRRNKLSLVAQGGLSATFQCTFRTCTTATVETANFTIQHKYSSATATGVGSVAAS